MIYLDSAATSLLKPSSVQRAVLNAMQTMASPGRGGHKPAMKAADTVLECRIAAAELFNVSEPEKVIFTMNATHALNIAINTLAKPGEKVVISGFEHNSVVRPLYAMGAEVVVAGRRLFDPEDTLREFREKLPGARLAVCTHVSNVFGYILPIYEIGALCRELGVPLIVDASQSAGVLEVDFKRLGADFIAMPGHKGLLGPQGTGILLCGKTPKPLMHGGSGADSKNRLMPEYLPDRAEAGTHNVCGIAGLLEGIRYVSQLGTEVISQKERGLLDCFRDELRAATGVEIFCASSAVQSAVLSMRLNNIGTEEAGQLLSEQGICVRSGLHCAPLAHESAGTLESGTVRFSFSHFLSEAQVRTAAETVKELALGNV